MSHEIIAAFIERLVVFQQWLWLFMQNVEIYASIGLLQFSLLILGKQLS